MGGSIGQSALVCQGQTRHSMLRAGGFPWTRAFRAGKVRWERKGEQARDLPAFAESPVRNGGYECEKGIHRSLLTAIASAAGVGEGGSASAGSAEDVKMLRAAARGASLRDGVLSEKGRRSPSRRHLPRRIVIRHPIHLLIFSKQGKKALERLRKIKPFLHASLKYAACPSPPDSSLLNRGVYS